MPFDPETSYAADYTYRDRVKDVRWEIPGEGEPTITTGLKGRWGTVDTPDLITVAANLGLSSEAAAVVVWEPKPSDVDVDDWEPEFAPKPGHILRRDDTEEGWLIASAVKSQYAGKWLLLCDKEITNA
jgi:hypothetical protein